MDQPLSKFNIDNNKSYQYIHIPPSAHITPPKPYILILHGFPSIPYDFHHQITYLSDKLGYGIIAPYLLGYHPTSSPADPKQYRLKAICNDIVQLLDHLDIATPVHGIGHDWGATLLSRLEYYHPTSLSNKLAYLTIAPVPFGQEFHLDQVNDITEKALGYAAFGYQKFFVEDPDRAVELLELHADRMDMLMFAEEPGKVWPEYFCKIGGMKNWLESDREVKMISGLDESLKLKQRETFCGQVESSTESRGASGYAGPLNWYIAHNENANVMDERSLRSDWEIYKADRSVLLVLCKKEPIAPSEMHIGMAQAYVKDHKQLTIRKVNTGHFPMLERPEDLNTELAAFFEQ